jgi:hypothetical protein
MIDVVFDLLDIALFISIIFIDVDCHYYFVLDHAGRDEAAYLVDRIPKKHRLGIDRINIAVDQIDYFFVDVGLEDLGMKRHELIDTGYARGHIYNFNLIERLIN